MIEDQLNIVDKILDQANRAGADSADAIVLLSQSTNIGCQDGKLESSELSESNALGLRVYVGQRSAAISTSKFSNENIATLVKRAVETAGLSPEDPDAGLLDPQELMQGKAEDLDLFDHSELSVDQMFDCAAESEAALLTLPDVLKSGGSMMGVNRSWQTLGTSTGFRGSQQSSGYSISATAVAGNEEEMETDSDWRAVHHLEDLPAPKDIGVRAGKYAVQKIGAKSMKNCRVPIIFEPRMAKTLLGHFASAVNGGSVAMGMSFLKDKLNQKIFPSGISIIDDPKMRRGLSSATFDAEGASTRKLNLVDDGVLGSWLLDARSARKLGMTTTGSARRSPHGSPGPAPSNIYLGAGDMSPDELIADIDLGIYVTSLAGQGVDDITGNYSRGARGMLIEKGQITQPVKNITIAGNLLEIFAQMTPASDLEFNSDMNAPTVRIAEMMVAGNHD